MEMHPRALAATAEARWRENVHLGPLNGSGRNHTLIVTNKSKLAFVQSTRARTLRSQHMFLGYEFSTYGHRSVLGLARGEILEFIVKVSLLKLNWDEAIILRFIRDNKNESCRSVSVLPEGKFLNSLGKSSFVEAQWGLRSNTSLYQRQQKRKLP
jgi:hypothetical protein